MREAFSSEFYPLVRYPCSCKQILTHTRVNIPDQIHWVTHIQGEREKEKPDRQTDRRETERHKSRRIFSTLGNRKYSNRNRRGEERVRGKEYEKYIMDIHKSHKPFII